LSGYDIFFCQALAVNELLETDCLALSVRVASTVQTGNPPDNAVAPPVVAVTDLFSDAVDSRESLEKLRRDGNCFVRKAAQVRQATPT
jgi:hypothetical protein